VFQAFHVLPHLSVADNVALPLLLLGRPDPARVTSVLERVGLSALGARWPAQLSGGQLQRVALARALVHRPALLLAASVREEGSACLLVTHAPAAARLADRVLRLQSDGVVDVAD
jgi:putative ABC transport system ATP-binding protein